MAMLNIRSLSSLAAIAIRLKCLPSVRRIASKPYPAQDMIRVYRLFNASAHPERGKEVDDCVGCALVKVWPRVMKYAKKKKITGELWAQIRCDFHTSGAPGTSSRSSHATIHVYDESGCHVGGIHAPENPEALPTFKGGIHKLSYHGEHKIEGNFAFAVSLSS